MATVNKLGEPAGDVGTLVVPGVHRCRSWQMIGTATALAQQATREILALVPSERSVSSGWSLDRIGCAAALSRGVSVRLVHEVDTTRCSSSSEGELAALVEAGAQVRGVDRVRQALVVFDRSVALLSTGSLAGTDLLVREPAIVATLSAMFTEMWRRAECAPTTDHRTAPDRNRTVLHLMSRGVTDESAARSMGISTRTYRRMVADVMARLGASSRFQAGVLAADRGWLGSRAPVFGAGGRNPNLRHG